MFSLNPAGSWEKQNKSSLGGGVQPRGEEQDPNTEAHTQIRGNELF